MGFTEGPGDGGLSGSGCDSDGWSNVGMMQHHFDGISVILPIDGTDEEEELVRPNTGTDVGGGTIQVVVYAWGGWTNGFWEDRVSCVTPAERRRIHVAGDPKRVTSNC